MRKNYLVIALFVLFIAVIGVGVLNGRKTNTDSAETVSMTIEGKKVKLLVADTETEWAYGLMNRRTLPEADGMVFMFPKKEMRTFWNMNTFMDLKVVWMDGNQVIGTSELPSIDKSKEFVTVHSPAPADKVVELVR